MGRVVNLHHAVFEKAQKYIRKFENGFESKKILNKFIYEFSRPSTKLLSGGFISIIAQIIKLAGNTREQYQQGSTKPPQKKLKQSL
jgi:hypothetical protein